MKSPIYSQTKKSFRLFLNLLLSALLLALYSQFDANASSGIRYVTSGGNCNGATPCYSNIQAAVNAASSGDEIRVATGNYSGINYSGGDPQVVYVNKSVTIRGGYSINNWYVSNPLTNPTIVDAHGQGRGIKVSGSGITVTLFGLTIQNGDATDLGGTAFFNAGGGIFVNSASLIMDNCRILNNTAGPASIGGGVYTSVSANVLIENSLITNNEATSGGSGLHISRSEPVIIRANTISGNLIGAGLEVSSHNALIEGNLIQANSGDGLAIRVTDSQANIKQNQIIDNGKWGVFIAESATFTMTNNIVALNQLTGISLSGREDPYGNPLQINGWLYHNTIADNGPTGIRATGYVNLTLINNALANHNTSILTAQETSGNPYITLDHTLFDGLGTYINSTGGGTVIATGDVIGQPAFVGNGNYHLQAASVAISAGLEIGINIDIDGDPRPIGNAPEIGADEFVPPPTLAINYMTGAPGSYFAVTGQDFPPNEVGNISINGVPLGTVSTTANGTLLFILSTANADEGIYFVTVSVNPSAHIRFVLDANEPLRPQEGSGPIFAVQPGLAFTQSLYLPTAFR